MCKFKMFYRMYLRLPRLLGNIFTKNSDVSGFNTLEDEKNVYISYKVINLSLLCSFISLQSSPLKISTLPC